MAQGREVTSRDRRANRPEFGSNGTIGPHSHNLQFGQLNSPGTGKVKSHEPRRSAEDRRGDPSRKEY